jgi:hypothetical protein
MLDGMGQRMAGKVEAPFSCVAPMSKLEVQCVITCLIALS